MTDGLRFYYLTDSVKSNNINKNILKILDYYERRIEENKKI